MTKDVETETRTVGGDVRSEDVEIDGDTGDTDSGFTDRSTNNNF
jgi:stress response protein YsnF